MTIRPFVIHVPQVRLDHIHARLRSAEWPVVPDGAEWTYGTSVSVMRELVDYWLHDFDWRAQEARLNGLPNFIASIDSQEIHFVHVPGKGPAPKPLLLSHGWPGSFVEFCKAVGPLTDPAAHGGDPADAFSVVIPSLPGFGFSAPPPRPVGPRTMARQLDRLMREKLGYDRYIAQGGDWGSAVSCWLGYEGAGCEAVHINFTFGWTNPLAKPETPAEVAAMEALTAYWRMESGYMAIQSTKPLTLDFAMSDSPLGSAAWIVEKFRTWSELADGNLWSVYSRDEILTNIMAYVATGHFGTAAWVYRGVLDEPVPPGGRVERPVGVSNFPGEGAQFPRSWVEKSCNVVRWTNPARGGHFAAMEQPLLFTEEVRAFARQLRTDAKSGCTGSARR